MSYNSCFKTGFATAVTIINHLFDLFLIYHITQNYGNLYQSLFFMTYVSMLALKCFLNAQFPMLTANDTSLKRADYLVLLLNIYSVKVTLRNRAVPFSMKIYNVLVV